MAQKHNTQYIEKPMTTYGRTQGPSRRYRRLRHPIFPAAVWVAKNPLLQRGEIGAESDTYRLKIGDGVTYWNDLPYASENVARWGDIIGTLSDQTDLKNALDSKANSADLGTAAYTAATDYATAAQGVKADTAVQPGDLATVATTGDYDDLLNKPTIPTVNDATLTIQKNGADVATFTANANTNATANITVPTATSDLVNDNGFVSSLSDLGITATAAEINVLDGITATTTELNYTDGVTSNIQDQLDNKENTLTAGSNITLTTISTIGKNKLDTNVDGIKVTATPASNLALNFTKWYLGAAFNGYMNQSSISGFTYGVGTITFKSSDASYGCVKFLRLKPSTTYTISCASPTSNHRAAVMCYNDNGDNTYKATTQIQTPTALPYSFTTNADPTQVYGINLYSQSNTEITYTNILLEEGNQATAYAPYTELFSTQVAATDTTYSDFTGATASDAGASGLVPAPAAGDQAKFLQGDGTWATPTAIGANTDLSNLTATGANIGNWSSNVTNCITNIPQDIQLTLDTATHTLKLASGSKYYYPNGTGVFDNNTTTAELTLGPIGSYTGQCMIYVNVAGSALAQSVDNTSGTTAPSGSSMWYDITANLVKSYSGGSDTGVRYSFPIAIATRTNGNWTSIDQVFNGFGYIGSTVFALPDVKGLIPNGFNTEGTLKNIEFVVSSVLTKNLSGTVTNRPIVIKSNDIGPAVVTYNEETNYNSNTSYCICGKITTTNSVINSFSVKKVFHGVDYSSLYTEPNTFNGETTINNNLIITEKTSAGQQLRLKYDGSYSSGTLWYPFLQFMNNDHEVIRCGANQTSATASNFWVQVFDPSDGTNKGQALTVGYDGTNSFVTASASDKINAVVTTIAKSKSKNGCFKLGNGLIVQWGYNGPDAQATTVTVNFSTPFTNADSFSVVAICEGGTTAAFTDGILSKTTTGFTFYGTQSSVSNGNRCHWIAIGY